MIEFIVFDPEMGVYWGLDSDQNVRWLGGESLVIEALIKDGLSPSDAREVVLTARMNRGYWIATRKEAEVQKFRSPQFKGLLEIERRGIKASGDVDEEILIAIDDLGRVTEFLLQDVDELRKNADLLEKEDKEILDKAVELVVEARNLVKLPR